MICAICTVDVVDGPMQPFMYIHSDPNVHCILSNSDGFTSFVQDLSAILVLCMKTL